MPVRPSLFTLARALSTDTIVSCSARGRAPRRRRAGRVPRSVLKIALTSNLPITPHTNQIASWTWWWCPVLPFYPSLTLPRGEYRFAFRYIVGKSRHRAHTESQREESGESQFLGSLWRATLSREAWMPIWGLSTESMSPGRSRLWQRLWNQATEMVRGYEWCRDWVFRSGVGSGTLSACQSLPTGGASVTSRRPPG